MSTTTDEQKSMIEELYELYRSEYEFYEGSLRGFMSFEQWKSFYGVDETTPADVLREIFY